MHIFSLIFLQKCLWNLTSFFEVIFLSLLLKEELQGYQKKIMNTHQFSNVDKKNIKMS